MFIVISWIFWGNVNVPIELVELTATDTIDTNAQPIIM